MENLLPRGIQDVNIRRISYGAGDVTSPTMTFLDNQQIGLYSTGSGVGVTVNGSNVLTVNSSGIGYGVSQTINNVSSVPSVPSVNTYGYLYKKSGSSGLFWSSQGLGEIDLTALSNGMDQISFDNAFAAKRTDDLTEGTTNLYMTQTRFNSYLSAKTTTDVAEGSNLYYTNTRADARVNAGFASKTTTNLAEGTNLYYTNDRADARFASGWASKTTDNLTQGSTNLFLTTTQSSNIDTNTTAVTNYLNQNVKTSATPTFAGLTLTGALTSYNLIPADNTKTVGGALNYYGAGYITSIYGTLQTASQPNITGLGTISSTLSMGADIIPGTNNSYDLGSSSYKFHSGYINALYCASLNISTLSTGILHSNSSGDMSSSLIVNADVSASAAIADTKLATISTSGKVSNSATTAVSTNTSSAIVARDSSGNFAAGTITASLTGHASLDLQKDGDTMTGALTMSGANIVLDYTTGNVLKLSSSGNSSHQISYSSTYGGPEIRGLNGGCLTTSNGGAFTALSWGTAGVTISAITVTGHIKPAETTTSDLGSSSKYFNSGYIHNILGNNATLSGMSTAGVVHNNSSGALSSSLIVNADITDATITNAKLNTVSSTNTGGYIVVRDGSGDYSANIATLAGINIGSLGNCFTSSSNNLVITNTALNGDIIVKLGTSAGGVSNFQIQNSLGADICSIYDTGTMYIKYAVYPITDLNARLGGASNRFVDIYGYNLDCSNTITFGAMSTAGVLHNDSSGVLSSSLIVNADVSASAAIADTKLATISTSGKVSNSATTAVSTNTSSAIVARDSSGNFAAGTITASLTGLASLNLPLTGGNLTGQLSMTAAAPCIALTSNGASSYETTISFDNTAGPVMKIGISYLNAVSSDYYCISSAGVLGVQRVLMAINTSQGTGAFDGLVGLTSIYPINKATGALTNNSGSIGASNAWYSTAYITSINGTLLTASQPNITSVGSLTGLTIPSFSTAGVIHNDGSGVFSSSLVVNADVSASAAIADTKLATISTSGKVSNSATTATAANTASAIVARDSSGNFTAGAVTVDSLSVGALGVCLSASSTDLTINNSVANGDIIVKLGSTAGTSFLYINNSSSVLQYMFNDAGSFYAKTAIMPITNGGADLGGSSAKWNNAYINNLDCNTSAIIRSFSTAGVVHNDSSGNLSTGLIDNADVSASAAIVDTKLATIATSGKVSNSATTATSSLGTNTIVMRDGSNNFAAGTITASLTGLASLNLPLAGGTMSGGIDMGLNALTGVSGITIPGFSTAGIIHNNGSGVFSSGLIDNADVSPSAAIVDTKLATISTSGKVSNSATTAVSTNTSSTIVARDSSGNFAAGTITASLTGLASLNLPLAGGTMTGKITLNDNIIELRTLGDANHLLRYSSSIDGPELRGAGGGALSTNTGGTSNKLTWNTSGVNVEGVLTCNAATGNQLTLNQNDPTNHLCNIKFSNTTRNTELGIRTLGENNDFYIYHRGAFALKIDEAYTFKTRKHEPLDNATHDLGSGSMKWNNLYVNDTVYCSAMRPTYTGTGGEAAFANASNGSYNGSVVKIECGNTNNTDGFNFLQTHNNGAPRHRLRSSGDIQARSGSIAGFDYAEFFESVSGLSLTIGKTVVLQDGKVRYYNAEIDTPDLIVGVIRSKAAGNSCGIVGNAAGLYWAGKYLQDEYDDIIIDETGNFTDNPAFDPAEVYIPRENRPEWNLIGLLGQLTVNNGETVNPRWVLMKIKTNTKKYLVR